MIQEPSLNDQLKQQSLDILKSIQEGTPEAFSIILEEVSRYNLFMGGVQLFIGVVLAIALIMMTKWAMTREWKLGYRDNKDDSKLFVTAITSVILLVTCPIAIVEGINNFSVGVSPLGWLVTQMVN